MSEMYKLPPEPAVGTVLRDVETGEYTRRTETGWTVFLSARPADTVVGFGGWPNMLARAGGALVEAPPEPVTVPGWGGASYKLMKTLAGHLRLRDDWHQVSLVFTPDQARKLAAAVLEMVGDA